MRRLGPAVVLLAAWLLAAGCGGGGAAGNAGSTVAVGGAGATAGGGGAAGAGGGFKKAWGPVEPVTPHRRYLALTGAAAKWAALKTLPDVAGRRKQMAEYLSTQADFEEAAAEANSVWARFKDQRVMIIVDDPPLPSKARTKATRVVPGSPALQLGFGVLGGVLGGGGGMVPTKQQAHIFDAFPNIAGGPTDEILTKVLKAENYEIDGNTIPTIEALKTVNDDGVLYFNTHGGVARLRPGFSQISNAGWCATPVYALATYDPVLGSGGVPLGRCGGPSRAGSPSNMNCAGTIDVETTAEPDDYKNDLDGGGLAYMNAPFETNSLPSTWNATEWHYAITDKWVTSHHWKPAEHALVWLNVCDSFNEDLAPNLCANSVQGAFDTKHISSGPFRAALGANVGMLVGWDHEVDPATGTHSAQLAFDRLLGTNQVDVPADTPPFRPFGWANVYQALQKANLTVSSAANSGGSADAHLKVSPTSGEPLAPGITYIDIKPDNPDTIVINGEFGDDPGRDHRNVYMSQQRPAAPSRPTPPDRSSWGTEIPYADCAWQPTKVTCQLTGNLADKGGWVRVVAQGHPSNPVPLTTWTPTIVWSDSGTTQRIDIAPIFRADIHTYRENAIGAPRSRDPFPIVPSWAASTCHINGLMQFLSRGKGVSKLDVTFDNASWMKNILFLPAAPQPPFHASVITSLAAPGSPTQYGTCAAGGTFTPTTGEWAFNFGALFRAEGSSDGASRGRQSPGPSASAVAQAQQTVRGTASADGTGAGPISAPLWAGGPSLPKDDKDNAHTPTMVALVQYDPADKDFVQSAPPPLKLDPATPKDRETAGHADFKAGDWRKLLKDDRPHTTLRGFDGLWTGSYAPDDKTAR